MAALRQMQTEFNNVANRLVAQWRLEDGDAWAVIVAAAVAMLLWLTPHA
ncbi:hypothetical protein MTX26_29805 [Bradyrhizobium sp. ISRA443]|nr:MULTISPECIES: hypothetical protein [unclassified Bradyrhizobium]WGR93795.1 hypothetical protein MTX20_04765 [Bradyrhizobium sp. ISRA435]WGR98399.1 hypothetical protein MTX23_29790 [Bradyrhizobium sp. ISRA436]WGS05288.1 hypothetical protein MTX18_29810 [Bradyrhizobium sp. ISRA437]WGS12174.1 hypothetical protein MTX26_29805 [Bradyrhizobium sp. ISRA443]